MTFELKRMCWLSLGFSLAVAAPVSYAALTPEKLYQKVLPSVMTLEVENQNGERFIGSAVLALADDVALTAWHVVADARCVWAVFADGQRVQVTGCIDHNGGGDLALLKLAKRLPHRQAVVCRVVQPVAARVYVIGAPKGYDFSISDGLISQLRTVDAFRQYQLSCPISPGNSGSPILNQRGEVIAIASWTKTDAQNMSFATPSQEFSHLNVFAQPKTWEQLAANAGPTSEIAVAKSRRITAAVSEPNIDPGDFTAFQKRLSELEGRCVIVVIQDDSRTNRFRFTVTK